MNSSNEPAIRSGAYSNPSSADQFIVYDGSCGFCTKAAAWLVDRIDAPVQILPNTPDILARFDLTAEEAARALQWIAPNQRSSGAAAVSAWLSASTARRWRLLGRFIASRPVAPLASAIYWFVARNRTRLSWIFKLKASNPK